MNEINQVIIFLDKYIEIKKLDRLIKQINENEINNIILVGNTDNMSKKYKKHKLISSNKKKELELMKEALNYIDGPFVSFNSNMVLENDLVKYVLGSDFENKNVFFTTKNINSNLYIKATKYGHITSIKKHKSKRHLFSNILRIHDTNKFKEVLSNLENNYLDIITKLDFEEASIEYFYYSNDKIKAINIKKIDFKKKLTNITLIDINTLKPIEDHDKNRANKLKNKILEDKYWTVPIIVENKNHMILDGHHRFEVSKKLNLKYIPAILVNYNDVKVWSLRNEIKISVKNVSKKVNKKKQIYPYKTVKHKYEFTIPNVNYSLSELKYD